MIVYRIPNWSKYFENSRSRTFKACRFVCMPNKQDGLGFLRIMGEDDGAAVFGIWCMILQACSRQSSREGWLTDDGTKNGRPWDFDDLAMRWRRPVAEIQRCLEVILHPKIGWLEQIENKCPPSDGAVSAHCPLTPLKGREGKGREGKGIATTADAADGDGSGTAAAEPEPTELARKLATWVQWRTKDSERSNDNLAELVGLIQTHSLPGVQSVAEELAQRERRKVWPNEINDSLLSRQPEPSNPIRDTALALVEKHGWEACRLATGCSEKSMPDRSTVIAAMTDNPALADQVAAKLGAP